MNNKIEIQNIVKNFGETCAADNISLTFEQGKIYGLLGRNGAGKSTLLNILSNRILADSGTITIDGEKVIDGSQALDKIFIMSDATYYPSEMKVSEAIKWTKQFYSAFDEEYANSLIEMFELKTNKRIKELSTGFTTIFKTIIALSVNTPYIFLDEPTLGLDANNREIFHKIIIEKYSATNCSIIISTHLIEEISGIIEEVVIMKKGKLIRDESAQELLVKSYSVTGKASDVDEYITDKNVIGSENLSLLKTAYILDANQDNIPDTLTYKHLELQKLFVLLTNS